MVTFPRHPRFLKFPSPGRVRSFSRRRNFYHDPLEEPSKVLKLFCSDVWVPPLFSTKRTPVPEVGEQRYFFPTIESCVCSSRPIFSRLDKTPTPPKTKKHSHQYKYLPPAFFLYVFPQTFSFPASRFSPPLAAKIPHLLGLYQNPPLWLPHELLLFFSTFP